MKRALGIILGLMISLRVFSQAMPVTNEVHLIVDFSSYDTKPLITVGAYIGSAFSLIYNQYTNSINSDSRSGADLENQRTNQQPQLDPVFWCLAQSNHVTPFAWHLANDNGAYDSNKVYTQSTRLFSAPASLWNGTADTNEGFTMGLSSYMLGANPNDVAGCDGGAVSRNSGCIQRNTDSGVQPIDLWHDTATNGWISDQAGARILGFQFGGGHFNPSGGLAIMISIWRQMGLVTNIGSITFDFGNGSCSSSNQFAANTISQSGGTFTCTIRPVRFPPAWDTVPPGTTGVISNLVAAPDCFAAIPSYGNVFNWTMQFTNFSTTGRIYNAYLNGVFLTSATDAQWSQGVNLATNIDNTSWSSNRLAVLQLYYAKYGVDPYSHTNTHGAGDPGLYGPDLINYQSLAQGDWQAGMRGATLVNSVMADAMSMRTNYDVRIFNAAQPIAGTLTLVLQPVPGGANINTATFSNIRIGP